MRTVGLFEAKTKLSEICRKVADTGEPVLVTRRGAPLVRIEPVSRDSREGHSAIWETREASETEYGPLTEELPFRERSIDTVSYDHNPLD